MSKEFGELITHYRGLQSWTRIELARQAEYNVGTLRRVEKGKRSFTSHLAEYFGQVLKVPPIQQAYFYLLAAYPEDRVKTALSLPENIFLRDWGERVSIGSALREYSRGKFCSNKQIAKAAGHLDPSAISLIFRDERKPLPDTLLGLIDALAIPPTHQAELMLLSRRHSLSVTQEVLIAAGATAPASLLVDPRGLELPVASQTG